MTLSEQRHKSHDTETVSNGMFASAAACVRRFDFQTGNDNSNQTDRKVEMEEADNGSSSILFRGFPFLALQTCLLFAPK